MNLIRFWRVEQVLLDHELYCTNAMFQQRKESETRFVSLNEVSSAELHRMV